MIAFISIKEYLYFYPHFSGDSLRDLFAEESGFV